MTFIFVNIEHKNSFQSILKYILSVEISANN